MDFIRASLLLLLPFFNEIWQIYVVLFFIFCCSAGFTSVYQSIIPEILDDKEKYQKALSYSRLAYNMEMIISPILAGLLLMWIQVQMIFLVDAFTFFISGLFVFFTVLPTSEPTDRPSNFLLNIRFGIVSYFRTPRLKAVFILYIAIACTSAMVIVNTVVYVKQYLNLSDQDLSMALAITGVGSILFALLTPKLIKIMKMRYLLLTGGMLMASVLIYSSQLPGWWLFLILWFLLGAGLSISQTPIGLIVTNSCKKSDSSAFFAANFSLSHLCWLGAYLLAGYLSSYHSLEVTFLIMGLLSILSCVLFFMIYPEPDEEEIEHTHSNVTHTHAHTHDSHHPHNHIDVGDDHEHSHTHEPLTHKHKFVIDYHHPFWPSDV